MTWRTSEAQLEALRRRVLAAGTVEVTLPAEFLAALVEDLTEAREERAKWERMIARLDAGQMHEGGHDVEGRWV